MKSFKSRKILSDLLLCIFIIFFISNKTGPFPILIIMIETFLKSISIVRFPVSEYTSRFFVFPMYNSMSRILFCIFKYLFSSIFYKTRSRIPLCLFLYRMLIPYHIMLFSTCHKAWKYEQGIVSGIHLPLCSCVNQIRLFIL